MDPQTRRCKPCGRTLPLTTEYFSRHKNGFDYRCKECRGSYFKKKYYPAHAEQILAKAKDYRREHKDQIRQQIKQYIQKTRHLARARSRKFRESHLDAERKRLNAYYKLHPEKANAHTHNRRAKQRSADGTHTGEDINRQYKVQHGRCYWCKKPMGSTYHVDHVIPLSRGGSNGPDNLVIACPHCNESKGAKLPHEWEGSGGKLL